MAPLASWAARYMPEDFTEASQTGGLFTVLTYCVMVIVFFCELFSFMSSSPSSYVMLDKRDSDLIQINFDIDLYDIECRNVRLLCISQSNDEPLQISSQDFWLRSIDAKGRTFGMATKPDGAQDEGELVHQRTMKQLVETDGQAELDSDWATSHDGFKHSSFEHVIKAHDFTMINFFAGWCGHCQHFSPTWAEMAEQINGNTTAGKAPTLFPDRDGTQRSVRLIKLNCVDFQRICNEKGVDAYPMIRLYKADGSFSLYEGRRDKQEITRWIERTVKMKSYGWAANHEAFERGCNARGRMQVPRVPGHLEFMAGGGDQTLNPSMTNVSHLVKHLSFSDPDDGKYHRKGWTGLPPEILGHLSPMDGNTYVTKNFHEAWIHDFKVISTVSAKGQTTYQFTHQHRLSKIATDMVPQAQFHFDIEPFSIYIRKDEKKWYDFATSLMAILGGIFAMMRLASNASLSLGQILKITSGNARNGLNGLVE